MELVAQDLRALQAAGWLDWDLASAVTYEAGETISTILTITNNGVAAKKFYVVGHLLDASTLVHVDGSWFGVKLPAGGAYYMNDMESGGSFDVDEFTIAAGGHQDLSCQFVFTMSDCVLFLSVQEEAGAIPDLVADVQRGTAQSTLSSAAGAGFDISAIMELMIPIVMIVLVLKMVGPMMK